MGNKIYNLLAVLFINLIFLIVCIFNSTTVNSKSDENPWQKIYFPLRTVEITSYGSFKIDCSMRDIDNTGVKYTYTSSNKNVVTVDSNGVVRGVSDGVADIEVIAPSYKGRGTLTVEVKTPNIIMSDKEEVYLKEGQHQRLNVSCTKLQNDGKFTFKSLNDNIASVNNDGVITAKSYGTTVVRITYNKDSTIKDVPVNVRNQEFFADNILFTFKDLNGKPLADRLVLIKPYNITVKTNIKGQVYINNLPSIQNVFYLYDRKGKNIESLGYFNINSDMSEIGVQSSPQNLKVQYVKNKEVKSPIPVTSVTVSESDIDINIGSEYKINYSIAPYNATNKQVQFISKDSGIALVNEDGIIVGKTKGKTKIDVITVDGNKTAEIEVYVASGDSKEYSLQIIIIQLLILLLIVLFVGRRYYIYLQKEKERVDNMD